MEKLQAISSEASAEDAVSFTPFSIKPSVISSPNGEGLSLDSLRLIASVSWTTSRGRGSCS
jgi:hypothetical protein